MKVLKFHLSGKTAFFKKPDVNSYYYFSYSNIHKIALLGLLGGILGLGGYYKQYQEKKKFPDFYQYLQDLKVAIVPTRSNEHSGYYLGHVPKKMQIFNNSVGYASQEEGGNLIVKEQWLENPEWDIYLLLSESSYGSELEERLLQNKFVYIPYLGKNDHFADIAKAELLEAKVCRDIESIEGLFLKGYFDLQTLKHSPTRKVLNKEWKYEEKLPLKLAEVTNQYQTKSFIATNMKVVQKESYEFIYSIQDRNLFFF